MTELRTPAELEQMRAAGRFVGSVLGTLSTEVSVGTNLLEIDARVRELIADAGAESCYVDYHPSFGDSPFGHVICTSINDGVLHGLPHRYQLQNGDLVSLDFAASVDGWVADSAVSFVVGTPREEDLRLIAATEQALAAGIEAFQVGVKLGEVSAAIGAVCKDAGYLVNTQFGGHGVGRTMHGDPHLPNDGRARRGPKIEAGLVMAIEPWLMAGTDRIQRDPDGWTLRSIDGTRGAHSEHTVAATAAGPLVLTAR